MTHQHVDYWRTAQHPRRRRTATLPLVAVGAVAMLTLVAHAGYAAAPCLPCPDGTADLVAACEAHEDRKADRQTKFDDCTTRCQNIAAQPQLAGRCAFTRDCLDECRVASGFRLRQSVSTLKHAIRKACSSDTRPRCRISRHDARLLCNDLIVTTTSTSTTTTTVTIASTATTSAVTQAADDADDDDDEDKVCSGTCVARIQRFCRADCAEACGDDHMAFNFCVNGCRNKNCPLLVRDCDCSEGEDCTIFTTTTIVTTTTTTTTTSTTTTTIIV